MKKMNEGEDERGLTARQKKDVVVTPFDHDRGRLRSNSFVIVVENDDFALVIFLRNRMRDENCPTFF